MTDVWVVPSWYRIVGVDEIIITPFAWLRKQRMGFGEAHPVPAHVGDFDFGGIGRSHKIIGVRDLRE